MRGWSDEERKDNARGIMRGNIERDPVGRKLTPAARERAVEFAVDAWKGRMGNGQAAQLGIKHVTAGIFKE